MTEKLTLKERAVRGYWSIVGIVSALILSLQPVLADDIWSRFSTIMKDVYGELVGISTINPAIGDMQMQAVTTIVVDRFYKQLERTKPVECNGRKPRTEKLTPANIEKIHKLIRCAFDQAVRWEVIGRNPFSGALIPKHVAKKRAMWTIQTIVKAMDECTDAKLYLAMNLAFACSMREGEILGLQWDRVHISDADIANDDAHLYVDCELARVNKQAMEKLEDKGILFKFPSIMSNCRSTVISRFSKSISKLLKTVRFPISSFFSERTVGKNKMTNG